MTIKAKALIGVTVATLAVLALATPASAAPTYQTSFGAFDAGEPQQLTVDQDTGDVYAIDNTNGVVRRFDSSGNAKNFTAGPDAGTNTLGATAPFTFFHNQLAVDRSGGDSDGNIYVIEQGINGTGQIRIFSNAGAPLGVIDGTATPFGSFGSACGVAVDQSTGDLYVGDIGDFVNGNVFRYSPSSGTVAESDYSGAIATEASTICNVAAAQGTVFAGSTNPFFGDGSVRAYPDSAFATGPPPQPTGTLITASGATTLDADPATGNVYVDRGNQISVFDSSGASVYDFGSAAEFSGSAGVAINGQSGLAYVGDPAGAQVDVFASPQPPTYQTSFGAFDAGEPQQLTVDQDTGDVYAIDNTNGVVRRFDSSGNAKNFTAGPDAGTNTLGATAPFTFFHNQLAVDRSGGDSDGNIYVIEQGINGTGQIRIFSNAGVPLGVIDGTATPFGSFGSACGVAVDQSTGDLYVGDIGDFVNGNVFRYSPSSGTVAESDYSGAIATEASTICNVAAAQGTVFAGSTNPFFGDGSVRAYPDSAFATGPPPQPTGTLITASGATTLDADPATGNVYVDRGNQISVFDSSGASVYDFGSAAEFSGSAGVAINGQSGVSYVGDPAGAQVDVFASAPPAFAPGVVTQPATAVGPDTATLHATVNPRSGAINDCHFDYLTEADFEANPPADRFAGADTAPCDVDPGAGADPVPVSAELTGLPSGTSFRYRISAANSEGTSLGDPVTFTTTQIAFTDPATGTNHFTNATLNGHIDTAGDTITDCFFDYGPDDSYGQTADCNDVTLPITSDQAVSAFVNELPLDDAVHFRLHLVTASYGDALGPDRVFLPASTILHEFTETVGSPGTGAGQLATDASDVAVDQGSGDVWVSDTGNHRVVRFDSDGDFISATGWGVSDGTAAFQVCTSGCQAGIPGNAPGQFEAPGGVAVDNSGGPSDGHLYVLARTTDTVTKLDPSGGLVAAWGTGGQVLPADFSQREGIAVDASGRLSVTIQQAFGGSLIERRAPATGSLQDTLIGSVGGPDIAIESDGSYLLCCEFGAVRRFDPQGEIHTDPFAAATHNNRYVTKALNADGSGIQPGEGGIPEGVDAALDSATGDLYLAARQNFHSDLPAEIRRYRFDAGGDVVNSDGSLCTPVFIDFSFDAPDFPGGCDPSETFAQGDLAEPRGVDTNAASRRIYVTDSGTLKLFDGFSVIRPTLTLGDPAALTASSVTLNAAADPEGEPLTECRFSYIAAAEYQANPAEDRFAGAATADCDPDAASVGDGSGDVPISAAPTGLDPATTYHFHLQASNSDPRSSVTTSDRTFTTRGGIISRTEAHPVTDTDAVLRARVNPQGELTTYHFEYGTDTSYGSSTPESTAVGGSTDRALSQFADGLSPGTTYHFRLVATNADATVAGPDATFTTAADADTCPNAAFRTGYGFRLPDCRAYERASIADKHGSHAVTTRGTSVAASDGSGVVYAVAAGLPVPGGQHRSLTVARRLADDWASRSLDPSGSVKYGGQSPDLALATASGDGSFWVGDTAAAIWVPAFSGAGTARAFSADRERFLIESLGALTPDAVSGKPGVFLYDQGSLSLVSRRPALPATDCDDSAASPADHCVVPPDGAFAGSYDTSIPESLARPGGTLRAANTISADASRIVFTESGVGRLYLRHDGDATAQLNASQAAAPDSNGPKPAAWSASSADGDTVYFTSCERLTDDSTAVSSADPNCAPECPSAASCAPPTEGSDLYRYDVPSGQLTDLTVDPNPDPRGADIQRVLGASADGSFVYFAANGRLAPGAPAGNCVPGSDAGSCQLYLIHDGGPPQAIATLTGADVWSRQDTLTARSAAVKVAADGTLLIASNSQLTAYDNAGPACSSDGAPVADCRVLYRYRPGGPALTCVSCPPGGVGPVGHADLQPDDSSIFGVAPIATPQPTRSISADGDRVVFETPQALLPADVNGPCERRNERYDCGDVYQWQASGIGSCHPTDPGYVPSSDGCLYLLSTGTSDHTSFIVDASLSGGDVFIRTTDRLVPSDTDDLYDVYDVRVGGGFASQHPAAVPPCIGDDCQGPPPGRPSALVKGSSQPAVGNQPKDATPPPTCKKNQKLKNGKCGPKKKRKKKGKKK